MRAVAYSPSGVHIASASLDGQIKIWHSMAGIQVRDSCLYIVDLDVSLGWLRDRSRVTCQCDLFHQVRSSRNGK